MKALVANLQFYLRVFAKKLVFAWQTETAYKADTIGNMLSTLFYNLTFVVFMNVVLKKFKTIAGYDFNDILVLTFFSQVSYYFGGTFTYDSVYTFVRHVRDGIFDTYFLKPVSLLFQVMTAAIKPFSGLIFSIPPLSIYVLLIIKNGALHPTSFGLTFGLLGLLVGFAFVHFYRFAFAMMVFHSKQVKNLLKMMEMLGGMGSYPYEAYAEPFRTIALFIAPTLASGGIPTIYFLNKTTSLVPFFIEVGLLILFASVTLLLWRRGLKVYESVSS